MKKEILIRYCHLGILGGSLLICLVPYFITISEVGFSLLLLCYVGNVILSGGMKWKRTVMDFPLGFLLFAAVISCIFSTHPLHSMFQLKLLRLFLIYYVLVSISFTQKELLLIFSVLLGCTSVLAAYMVLQHIVGYNVLPYYYYELQSPSIRIYPGLAQIMMIVFLFSIPFLLFAAWGRQRKILIGLGCAALGLGIYFSFTRSAWIGLLGSLLGLGFVKSKTLTLFSLISILFLLTTSYFAPQSTLGGLVHSVISPFDPSNVRYANNRIRFIMLKDAGDILKKRPLTGLGFDAYRFFAAEHHDTSYKERRISSDPISFLVNMGFIGLISYALLYGLLIYDAIRRTSIDRGPLLLGIVTAFFGFTVSGLFEPLFFNSKTLRLMIFLISLGVSGQKGEDIHARETRVY